MSLKHALLVTCAVVATTAVVRSQPNTPSPLAPAPLFGSAAVPARPADAASVPVGSPVQDGKLDLSALYYFASQNDLGRVAAEIKLLRVKNPDWQPPDDLFGTASGVDEQPLWDLFAKHDYVALHAKMAELKQGTPSWQPSSNLTGKLALAEANDALVKTSDAKQWPAVIEVATANKMLLTCANVDALWRTGEALARTGDEPRAVEAYRYVLSSCDSPKERLATAQKASVVLPTTSALDSLLQMERRLPDGHGEFEEIRLDRFRRNIGAAIESASAPTPVAAELDAITASAKTPAGHADAELLGWYAYAHRDYPMAQRWFRTALETGTSQKAAEGLVLALRDNNQNDEARAAAVQFAGIDPINRKLMVDVVAAGLTDPAAHAPTPEQMTAFTQAVQDVKSQDGAEALRWYADNRHDAAGAKVWSAKWLNWKGEEIEQVKSAEGAEALGWQLYQNGDATGAEAWFQKSANWAPSESAAVGLVVTARRLRHEGDYASRIAAYRTIYPRVAELAKSMGTQTAPKRVAQIIKVVRAKSVTRPNSDGWDRSADEIVRTFSAGRYDEAVAMMDKRRLNHKEPGGLSAVRGWAQYHQGDWAAAEKTFAGLDEKEFSDKKREALRLIQMGYTNPRYR